MYGDGNTFIVHYVYCQLINVGKNAHESFFFQLFEVDNLAIPK